jgi:hypothetical protein
MSGIDFSGLSDEQLLQLLTEAMAEAMNRGEVVRLAAQDAVLSTEEKLQIQQRVAAQYAERKLQEERQRVEREAEEKHKAKELKQQAEKTETLWSARAAIVAAIRQWGYDGDFEINIWSSGADRRVYFQKTVSSGRRGFTAEWKFCLYVTGNNYQAPGAFIGEGANCWFDDKQELLQAFLLEVANAWKGDMKMSSDTGTAEPSEKWLKKYLAVLNGGVSK